MENKPNFTIGHYASHDNIELQKLENNPWSVFIERMKLMAEGARQERERIRKAIKNLLPFEFPDHVKGNLVKLDDVLDIIDNV